MMKQAIQRMLTWGLGPALVLATVASAEASVVAGQVVLKDKSGNNLADASNVVVFMEGEALSAVPVPPQKDIPAMSSKNKEFVPEVIVVTKGSKVMFPNEDKIAHNAFSLSKTKKFDLGLYKKGEDAGKGVVFDVPGLVKVYCNIHERMVGYVLVLENQFYAITDKAGKFSIGNVPAGKFKLTAWQRYGEPIRKEVEVAGSDLKVDLKLVKSGEVEVELFEENRSIKHLNKWGQPYKDKY